MSGLIAPHAPADPAPTILIVDDTPANLAVVVEYLERHGIRVLVAQDGEEGLRRAEFVHPDLILLDVMMPGIDGLETCRRLQVSAATRDIPVIFMTALADTSHKLAGFAAGAVDYVTKPFDTAEVQARVDTHLALRRMRRRLMEQNRELEQRSAELEAARARLESITNTLFEGVLVVNSHGIVVFANSSARQLLRPNGGGLDGEAVDQVFRLRQDGNDVSVMTVLGSVTDGDPKCDHDALFVVAGDTVLAVDYACSPLEATTGERKAVISFRDIGALKAAQWNAMRTSRLASVGQLAAGIAHEINTPIQYVGDNLRFIQQSLASIAPVIKGIAGLEPAAPNPGQIGELRRLCQDSDLDYLLAELPVATVEALEGTERISHIVRSMKEFSHPGTTTKVATDINRAVDSTVTVSRNQWKSVATVAMDLEQTLPPVPCFAAEVNQVLLNLIVNAAQAIEGQGMPEPGEIRIATRRVGDEVEIRVSDTGPGVPPSNRDKIFDPFFTTKEVGKGTGQGLYLCYDIIVKKHHGKMYHEENDRPGATFVVRLPLSA